MEEKQFSPEPFLRVVRNPVQFRLFLLTRLPSAFFSGLRVRQMDAHHCEVSVPYKWFTRNPFRSTYFACLAMAAEMSTGALAMAWLYRRQPSVSMLVVKQEGEFFRKATGRTLFTCEAGDQLAAAIAATSENGEAVTVTVTSTGHDAAGNMIARFLITWSFKRKS